MTELSFAKQFLTKLDSYPTKLSSDNVVDPRTYPAQSAYILPRLPNTKRKRGTDTTTAVAASNEDSAAESSAGAGAGLTVSLQPLKPSPTAPSMTLASQPLTTSMFDLKQRYGAAHGLDAAKLKLLRNKKPVPDSKSLHDVLAEGPSEATSEKDPQQDITVEFSVMVMPGAAVAKKGGNDGVGMEGVEKKTDAAPVAQGPSGVEVLQREDFWADLKGFLVQRIRDEGEGQRLVTLFRDAWESAAAKP